MYGITGFGSYIPKRRLCRKTAAQANSWIAPGLKGRGFRSFAGWDEDSITMAVEACRNCVGPDSDRSEVAGVFFASTTPVFMDRSNAGIVAEALGLSNDVETIDLTGNRRAGSTALVQALRSGSFLNKEMLVVASDLRKTRAASEHELAHGDAAACIRLGNEGVLAELVGHKSLSVDFVDHFRSPGSSYEYHWEARWVREEGYKKLIPQAMESAISAAGLKYDEIDTLIVPCPFPKVVESIAAKAGVKESAAFKNHLDTCGDTGTSEALLMLVAALETAEPDQNILVVDFAQGCEAYVFRTTDAIAEFSPMKTYEHSLSSGVVETNYMRFLTFRELIDWEKGPRAEKETRVSLTSLYRNKAMLHGFVGSRCKETGTIQFPPAAIAADSESFLTNTMEPYCFAEKIGRIRSWSADSSVFTVNPPNYYGMVEFPEGGRLMMDIIDMFDNEIDTGTEVRMVFRIKDIDKPRDFTRYFWKAVPIENGEKA